MASTYDDNKFQYAKNNYSFENMQNDLETIQQKNAFYVRQLIDIRDNGLPTIPPSLKDKKVRSNSKIDKSSESTTVDIVNNDNYELILNQNTMYITGTLACASLIIGSILLYRK
jgi:hypothetical protein